MVEVFSRDLTGRVVARRKPHLGTMCLVKIIIGARTTHLRLHPARCHRITTHTGQPAAHGKRQQNVVELRVAVRLLTLPGPFRPVQVAQTRITLRMQLGADVDKSTRRVDQSGEDVGR